jgi:sulfate adenylyltransferase
MSGAFSPLDGFMTEGVYSSVVKDYRLGEKYKNLVWPMPITLDVDAKVC